MENDELFEARDAGLDAEGIRLVARRQLAGSIVVLAGFAVIAALLAMRPAAHEGAAVAVRQSPPIQQPLFVAPPGRRLAAGPGAIELP
jgi:hypothetical protein